MNRGGRWLLACAFAASVLLSGCGGDDGGDELPSAKPVATTDAAAEQQDAIAAFGAYWDEMVRIANAGSVPKDAFATTATGTAREEDITRLTRDGDRGTKRVGAPRFKDQQATVTGDTAVVSACINEERWGFVVPDREPLYGEAGWRPIGRELTKVDGGWLVSGYSPASTKGSCS